MVREPYSLRDLPNAPTSELGIDTIDPAYYTVADGDGQTTAARAAGVDVGGDP